MSRADYDYQRVPRGYYPPNQPQYEYYNQPYYPPDYYYDRPQEQGYYDDYRQYEVDRPRQNGGGGGNGGGRRRRRTDRGGGGGRSQGRSRRGRQQQGGGRQRNTGGGGGGGGGNRDYDEDYDDNQYPVEDEYYPEDDRRPARNDRRRRGGRRSGGRPRNDGGSGGGDGGNDDRDNRRRRRRGGGRRGRSQRGRTGIEREDSPAQQNGAADQQNASKDDKTEQWVKKQEEEPFDYEADDWKDQLQAPEEDTRFRTEDVTNTKGAKFEEYNLSRPLLRGLYEAGFLAPSPVQEESIPLIFMGKNVMCRAKNGTGKTGAYAIPCLEKVDSANECTQVLVLVPTRELALQTSKVIRDLGKYLSVYTVVTTGGTSLKDDIIRLKRTVHILVGTPGRVLDLLQNEHADIGECRLVVMDEADKLLSPDFVPLIENILQFSPEDRQLMLYSATFPAAVKDFQQNWMPHCEQVNLMDDLTLRGVTQYYAFVTESEKVHCLFTLFKMLNINQSIIFCNSINRVELLARKIHKLGFSSFYIHARMRQSDRNRVFHQFRMGKCRTLVCTDLITRGIDIQSVNVVINFDFPKASETYLHRIGRSGRFGHLGLAVNFITDKDRMAFYTIERELQTQIDPIPSTVDEKLYCS